MNRKIVSKSNNNWGISHKKVLQLVNKYKDITKLELAYRLKISVPMATSSINELIEEGIIEETRLEEHPIRKGGKVIKLRPNSRISIGISITKGHVVVLVMNLLNEILLKREKEYYSEDFLMYMKEAKVIINEVLDELNISEDKILGAGISIPGTLNRTLGTIEYMNIGFREIKLSEFDSLFNYPIYFENEANLSLIAEKAIRGLADSEPLLYIGINEGVGGGIFINSELFTGRNGRAGEFGHMRISSELDYKSNSIQDYISTLGLVSRYNKRTCVPINNFFEFQKLIEEKDYAATEILHEGIDELMAMIYNLTMVFDIQKIIIGGKVGRLIKDRDIDTFYSISKFKNFEYKLDVDIIFSNIKRTVSIGAALLPIIDFYKITYTH